MRVYLHQLKGLSILLDRDAGRAVTEKFQPVVHSVNAMRGPQKLSMVQRSLKSPLQGQCQDMDIHRSRRGSRNWLYQEMRAVIGRSRAHKPTACSSEIAVGFW